MTSSFMFACAALFSALAALAALMLPRLSVLYFMASAWVINQFIGFGFNHPHDPKTLTWAVVMEIAVLFSGWFAIVVVEKFRTHVNQFKARLKWA